MLRIIRYIGPPLIFVTVGFIGGYFFEDWFGSIGRDDGKVICTSSQGHSREYDRVEGYTCCGALYNRYPDNPDVGDLQCCHDGSRTNPEGCNLAYGTPCSDCQ
ncbi:hypothetical protein POV27_07735 [Aureisphaera galaxeae]|uniref:hypothetical protein n=1 Tax=Aureisphaera galaxeae TaxID=1538023 RepID=UPI002350DA36|nr:hypothetical protein [Aureisphaera galaxeae]MDC8003939.1 hypothetical protein [Aureisphaera galaxeae]